MLCYGRRGRRSRPSARRRLLFGVALAGSFAGLVLSLAGLVWLLNVWRLLPPKGLQALWRAQVSYEPAPDFRSARSIYPYSVVPGGVASAEEVQASVERDEAVAEHYRGIHVSRLEPIRASTNLLVYASFRNNNGIHWTGHPMRIPKGELLLSDGVNLIRGRCGNRLSFLPPSELSPTQPIPILPKVPAEPEPPEIVLDHGMPPIFGTPPIPASPLAPQPPTTYWPPPSPPVLWCCAVAAFPAWGGSSGYASTSPPGVLEPATLLLLGTGLCVGVLWWAGSRRRAR